MGYEIKVYIGKSTSSPMTEWKHTQVPYKDGSGFEIEYDEKGTPVVTGRLLHHFAVYAMVDLCKPGYQDDPLNELIALSFRQALERPDRVDYFYASGSNTEVTEDRYGARMSPVPLVALCAALAAMDDLSYRRLQWLKALADSMLQDSEQLEVMFFGY